MKYNIEKASDRGHVNFGWLNTYHSFSFGHYYNPSKIHFGALRVLNDDWIEKGAGFGMHPHDNMEIITIPLSGALAHQDTTGGKGVIEKFDVQVMSAGSGLQHSEFNDSKQVAAELLQIWVFPKTKNIAPKYNQKKYNPEDRKNKWQLIVAPDTFETDALQIHQDAWFTLGNFDAGHATSYSLYNQQNGLYVFVIEGEVKIADEILSKRDAMAITQAQHIELLANTDAEILLMEVPMNF